MDTRKDITIEEYENYLFCKELAEGTRKIYLKEVLLLEKFLNGRPVTKENMIAYKTYLFQSGMAVATQNLHIVAANHFLRYIGLPDCMVKTKQVQRRRSLENVISTGEYNRLLQYAQQSGREKYYQIMKTMALTGIRIGELKYITVETLAKGLATVHNKGKTRQVYLPDKLICELYGYCSHSGIESGVIFRGNTQNPISRIAVYKMLIRLAEQAQVPREKVYPHSFRHLFALTFMTHYGNLAELADILGHSNLETTRIYTVSSVQEKRRKLNEINL